jgi:hypothetical protein
MMAARARTTKNRRRRGGRVRQSMDSGITLSRFLSVLLSGIASRRYCTVSGTDANTELALRWRVHGPPRPRGIAQSRPKRGHWTAAAHRLPVQNDTLPRRDGSWPAVVAKSDRIFSRRHGNRLIDLFRHKLRARSVQHGVVIRACGSHREGS